MTTPQSEPAFDSEGTFLRAYLAGRDVPCPSCEYNLRDLAGDRCPECGQRLAVRVQLSEPKLAAFLTGLVGLSAGAGFSGLILLYWFIVTFILRRASGDSGRLLFVTFGGLAAEALALLVWLRFRGRLRTLTPLSRWMLAATCWVLSVLNVVWFSLSIW